MTMGQGRKPTDPDYGVGNHAFDADRLGMMDETELTDRLLRTFSAPGYSPPRLPAVAMELLALSRQPDVGFDAIETVLEKDAMLAAEVLAVARSAEFAGVGSPKALRPALVRVGLSRLRQIVMQAAMNMRVFRSKAYAEQMERLRVHSNATAHLARIVSRYTPFDEEQAFLCGLLHDIGIAGIFLALGDTQRGKTAPDLVALWPAIDRAHARAGQRMVQLWKLPPEVALAVGAHHSVRVAGMDHPLAATVCLAEHLTASIGRQFSPARAGESEDEAVGAFGIEVHSGVDRSEPHVVQRATHALGFSESQLELVRADAHDWAAGENPNQNPDRG